MSTGKNAFEKTLHVGLVMEDEHSDDLASRDLNVRKIIHMENLLCAGHLSPMLGQ